MDSRPIYQLRPAEVFGALETSPQGISTEEATARLLLYGSNVLAEEIPYRPWRTLLGFMIHPLSLLLWFAGSIAFVVREPVLGLVIWILVVVNAGFSFWREYRAAQAMHALRQLLPAYARVVRGGVEMQTPATNLVPGDVLVLAEGDNIPADARVVEEYGLRTNNATLTGDAIPARKAADASLREGISELERPNLVFAGTSVVSGTARAVVYETGMLTQFGRIAHLTQVVREQPSPLQVEMNRLTRRIALVSIGIGIVVFLAGYFEVGLELYQAFLLATGILVAAIPEGLPATITLSLAMAGQRLAQRGVLVKKLSVIETLGTISTICTDKSGTLTQNQMTVREVWVAGQNLSVSGVGYEPKGGFSPNPNGQPYLNDLKMLLTSAALCNNARLSPPTLERPQWTSLGDQTEAALRVVALKGGMDQGALEASYPRIHELPFDARRKRMSTIHLFRNGDQNAGSATAGELAFVKGAPREVLQLCTSIQIAGKILTLNDRLRGEVLSANDDYARRALRVLALAMRKLPPRTGAYSADKVEQELTFLGLIAMHDPPRPEVAEAVNTCLQAGIRMVMVTGDYGLTAESLARRIGMLSASDTQIVTGAELEAMDDIELQSLLGKEVIFARMAPEHKLRLVAAYQERGEVVAVTGDGVNDAPALRKADVGVVMGLIGTDVAKEAADIILTNDNFATIVNAIEEGRAVYDNLRKFMTYIFSSNVPEILPFMLTAIFGLPLALTVAQILAIDLGTDMFPALGLGMEKPEPDVMRRPPRKRDRPVVDGGLLRRAFLWLGMIEAVLCYTGFYMVYALAGKVHLVALPSFLIPAGLVLPSNILFLGTTVFHAGVVMAQVGNAFACRTELGRVRFVGFFSNRFLLLGIAAEVSIILSLIYIPPLAHAFDHVALPPVAWVWLVMYAPMLYLLEWIRKSVVRVVIHLKDAGKEAV